MSSWLPWKWGVVTEQDRIKAYKPHDTMHKPAIKHRFEHLLARVEPPATFKASDVAFDLKIVELESLGYEKWQDAVSTVIELAFEYRALGYCELFKGGKIIPEEMGPSDIQGGIRIMRKDM